MIIIIGRGKAREVVECNGFRDAAPVIKSALRRRAGLLFVGECLQDTGRMMMAGPQDLFNVMEALLHKRGRA